MPLGLSAAVGVAGPRSGLALSGRAATILLTAVSLVCALTQGLVVCALGWLAVAQWDPFADEGHWSSAYLHSHSPLPRDAGLGCAALGLGLLVAACVRLGVGVARVRGSAGLCRGHAEDLVVLEHGEPQAYALAGLPGRTVVTRSMLRLLSGPERRALLAHERSHVQHYHFAYVQLTTVAATANPLLMPLVRSVRLAVERWADADAAGYVGDRHLVATTLARASLASASPASAGRPPVALGAFGSDVEQRVRALSRPARRGRSGALVAVALVAVAACCVLSSGAVGLDLHRIVELAQAAAVHSPS